MTPAPLKVGAIVVAFLRGGQIASGRVRLIKNDQVWLVHDSDYGVAHFHCDSVIATTRLDPTLTDMRRGEPA